MVIFLLAVCAVLIVSLLLINRDLNELGHDLERLNELIRADGCQNARLIDWVDEIREKQDYLRQDVERLEGRVEELEKLIAEGEE